MTDEELLAILKKADALLGQYKEAVQPAADELARRKSTKVYGRKGAYDGKLGCQEAGSDTVCLHLSEKFRLKSKALRLQDKAITFDLRWFRKASKAGIKHIHISGYY